MLTPKLYQHKSLSALRFALLALVILTLLILGSREDSFKLTMAGYLHTFSSLLKYVSQPLYKAVAAHDTQLINLLYRLCYVAICLLFIQLYFWKAQVAKLAIYLYLSLLSFTFIMYALAEFLQVGAFKVAAFRVDTMIVTPMPIVLLIPALHLVTKTTQQYSHSRDSK